MLGMQLHEKRVLVSKFFAEARDFQVVFEKYDFEKNARELGMMMTILENHDENITLQGPGAVTFTDADGGEVGNPSDDEDLKAVCKTFMKKQ